MEAEMSLEKFRKIQKENPNEFLFKIQCNKCSHEPCSLEIDGNVYGTGGGCESCGYGAGASGSINILFKCKSCGNAFNLNMDVDEFEED